METIASFGFVTGCHAGDKFMVQATLASIKYFCPEIPICLVVDGTFDVDDLADEYDLIVLRVPDLPSAKMRDLIAGNYRAKMAAMWEGPFEFYVWMDSDAIVWGDFRLFVRTDVDFQIFWKESEQHATPDVPDGFKHFYFDPDKLKKFDPEFQWQGQTYFCSGAFACRKNAISFEEWAKIESWAVHDDSIFAWGEMGMLNYAVHSKAQRGELRIVADDLQHVWAHHGKDELVADCKGVKWQFPSKIKRPRVAHFCYRKPLLHIPSAYSKPFTIARLHHYAKNHSKIIAWLSILKEEWAVVQGKIQRRLERRLQLKS
ncbi:MAG: hypothetical protein F6K19_06135 [Cyanothece sp. SIO1E1]|nr:hypothetical protein [Cyanothece sp. SIO1E1]